MVFKDFYLRIIFLILLIGSSYSAFCPKPELLNPCECDSNGITCGGLEFIDLKHIFHKLSSTLSDEEKHFKLLYLNNRVIPELDENTFGNITFEAISIDHALNLTRIATYTFDYMKSKIQYFVINKTPLESYAKNYDIFHALSSMNNLKRVDIEYTNINEIPDLAFVPTNGIQNDLTTIHFPNNQISKNALTLALIPNIKSIDLSSNKLQHITSLNIASATNVLIEINLSSNELTSNSFNNESLPYINRPAKLILNYNNITFLEKEVFDRFLNKYTKNSIELSTLDCNDCRNYWLVKNYKPETRLRLFCSDDSSIFNESHFQKCTHFME